MKRREATLMTRQDFLRAVGVAAAAGVAGPFLSACAGGDEAGSGDPLKIGVLLPFTGVFAQLGEDIRGGMEVAYGEAGDAAGGREIQLVVEDAEGVPDIALQRARKLVERDQVEMVTGVVSSAVGIALRDFFDSSEKILVLSTAGAVELTRDRRSPYIFRTALNNWQPDWALGNWAFENVGRRVAVTGQDYAGGHEHTGSFLASFQENGGQLVGDPIWTPFPTMGDPAPFVTALRRQNAEMIYITQFGADAVTTVKALDEFGVSGDIPIVTTGFVVGEDVLPAEGDAALGIKNTLHWGLFLDNPVNESYVRTYQQRFDRTPNGHSVQGYWTARAVVEAVEALEGDTSDTQRVIEALEGVAFEGPGGAVRMDPETHQIISPMYALEVQRHEGELHNIVLEDLGEVVDPGDDSKGPLSPDDL